MSVSGVSRTTVNVWTVQKAIASMQPAPADADTTSRIAQRAAERAHPGAIGAPAVAAPVDGLPITEQVAGTDGAAGATTERFHRYA